ncbi:MAG TPA: 5-formyltetrahydrofolate cyclo-ligase, partial [Candidatus Thermoplasmatota archaeon]|nr:5-formyltetrahydrofolate cyclo-ligase [Candidatus Thermoplasmatota archaeon]
VAPEMSTVGLANAAWRAGKRVLFPRVTPGGLALQAVAGWSGFQLGPLGIPEPAAGSPSAAPEEADLAIVPGVAWDARGGRLGRGGGHYDRLLPRLRLAWGIGFASQVVPALPVLAHDRPVHRVWAPGLPPLGNGPDAARSSGP